MMRRFLGHIAAGLISLAALGFVFNPTLFAETVSIVGPLASGATINLGAGTCTAPSLTLSDSATGWMRPAVNQWTFCVSNTAVLTIVNTSGVRLRSAATFGWTSGDSNAAEDLLLRRDAAATLAHGATDAASPVAQIDTVQDVVAGTTDTAGAARTFASSQGTGTGEGGSILFKTAPKAASTATSQNALVTNLTVNTYGPQLPTATTVALIPVACSAGLAGTIRAVTDALSPALGVTIVGGGAVWSPIVCNGSNWAAF